MNKKDKLTFYKIEILFMIVMVALVILVGITIFTLTTQKRNVKNFQDGSEYLISFAKNAYSAIKMTGNTDYIVTGSDGSTKGMCITIKGLKDNDFLQKEYDGWEGYIVIWATNQKYVLNGYDSSKIKELTTDNGITKYNNDEFSSKVKTSFTGTSGEKGGTGSTDGSTLLRYEAACINEKIE